MCVSSDIISSHIQASKSRAIKDIANVATHELSHSMGMLHVTGNKRPNSCNCNVNVEFCSCGPKICVMSHLGHPGRSVTWSQCSYKQMKRIRDKRLDICLQNVPEKYSPDKGVCVLAMHLMMNVSESLRTVCL